MTAPHCEHDSDEFRVTRWQLRQIAEYSDLSNIVDAILTKPHDTRARPQPTALCQDDVYTGTCALQEKCMDYQDFTESIMDEITENEDEDPPCPIKCDHRVNPHAQPPATDALDKYDLVTIETLITLYNIEHLPKDRLNLKKLQEKIAAIRIQQGGKQE